MTSSTTLLGSRGPGVACWLWLSSALEGEGGAISLIRGHSAALLILALFLVRGGHLLALSTGLAFTLSLGPPPVSLS
jgi:hypothetical protein